jgi:probable addiction module antidote protein
MAEFMGDAFETQDAGYIAPTMGVVARAKDMAQIARETGLSRESLYRAFSEKGNPTLKTLLAIMKSLNIGFSAKLHTAKSATRKRNIAPKTTRKTECKNSRKSAA